MLFAVRFYDRPDQLAVRQQYLQAHIDWLDVQRDVILVGGSLRAEPGATPEGGLWVVNAPDRATIEALIESDPFWIHGLRARYEIHFWSKAFPERKVPV
ncbi:MAG: YciI family protein [Rhodocyclaceae bacterium]